MNIYRAGQDSPQQPVERLEAEAVNSAKRANRSTKPARRFFPSARKVGSGGSNGW